MTILFVLPTGEASHTGVGYTYVLITEVIERGNELELNYVNLIIHGKLIIYVDPFVSL